MNNLKLSIEIFCRKILEINAKQKLQSNSELWDVLSSYLSKTDSIGCGFNDYAVLYKIIRSRKPIEVLECGTGVSSLIIAYALMENERETGQSGRLTSMEEDPSWFDMSNRLIPGKYKKYVDFRLSEVIEEHYSIFRGVRYKHTPNRPYSFIFVDGPKYISPIDGALTFNLDFINVLKYTALPVEGLIDKRLSTVFVLQQLLGVNKVKYSAMSGLGFVGPCVKSDLGTIETKISSKNFTESLRLFGNSKLSITSNQ